MASWFNCKGIAKQGLYLVVVLVVERGGGGFEMGACSINIASRVVEWEK